MLGQQELQPLPLPASWIILDSIPKGLAIILYSRYTASVNANGSQKNNTGHTEYCLLTHEGSGREPESH